MSLPLEELLRQVRDGDLAVDEAIARMAPLMGEEIDLGHSRLDADRARRSGLPEVVFAEGKRTEDLLEIVAALFEEVGRVLVTRVRSDQVGELLRRWPEGRWLERARLWSVGPPITHADGGIEGPSQDLAHDLAGATRREPRVAVLSAGTSDAAIADEAAGVLEWSAVATEQYRDIGVAGLHRLTRRLDAIRSADVVIVAAGMDGALPSVVAGLVPAPVIAVPTSVGYGAAFAGLAPLLTMLNSCSPGIAVVNIDNGYGAAALAIKMLGLRHRA